MKIIKFYVAFLAILTALHFVAKTSPKSATADESFFIHLHDPRAMANVTVSAVHAGTVDIVIQLETVEELPLKAQAVTVTLSNPDKGIAPVTIQAQRTADDRWSAKMAASGAGRWNIGLNITLAPANTVSIASPILIN